MVNYSDTIKEFITENIDLIDNFQFNKLYEKCDLYVRFRLTQLLLDAEIDPLEYMTVIPERMYSDLAIKTISIPSHITSIGNYAFSDCDNLTNVTFAESSQLSSIGADAFQYCSNLTSITIPASVTSIGDCAFWECNSLTSVYITDLAAWCQIKFGGNPLHYAGNLYLNGNLVTELIIPDGVISIGDDAFYDCGSLTSVTIPDSVTSIGDSAFYGCRSLTSITIPASVTSIGNHAFFGCSKLTSINYNGTTREWKSINKDIRYNNFNKIICIDGDINYK